MTDVLILGGRPLLHAREDLRRYCGLDSHHAAPLGSDASLPEHATHRGASAEAYAYRFFDTLEQRQEDDTVRPVGVLAASVLHRSLRPTDLGYFLEHSSELESELASLPMGLDLAEAPEQVMHQLATLGVRLHPACGLSLLTKVLHAKRPRLVPPLDRSLTDCYRHLSGGRGEAAWPACVRFLRDDLDRSDNRAILDELAKELGKELGTGVPSALRLTDIALWMNGGR